MFEPASNYDGLQCEAESFPPLEAFAWTRDDTAIDSSFPRYTFTNVTSGELISATITISEVMFEDSALFTCNVANLGDLLKTDVSLSVRLRVKRECVAIGRARESAVGVLPPPWPPNNIKKLTDYNINFFLFRSVASLVASPWYHRSGYTGSSVHHHRPLLGQGN